MPFASWVYVAGIVKKPLEERARALRAYPWSSYQRYLGRKVYNGSRLGIDGEAFLAALNDRYGESVQKGRKSEDVALRRIGCWLEADRIVKVACRYLGVKEGDERCRRRQSWVRPVVARMLSRYEGLTQRSIAGRLGVGTGKSVSEQLQKLSVAMGEDSSLRRKVEGLERELRKEGNVVKH